MAHKLLFAAGSRVALTLLALVSALTCPMQGQNFTVIHTFTNAEGVNPLAGVTMDAAGNLYGTTSGAGSGGAGAAYRLRNTPSGWGLTVLYSFADADCCSSGRMGFGPDGALYGVTGDAAFRLQPPPNATASFTPWDETDLYRFADWANGYWAYGDLTFDQAGNIYGVTRLGGPEDFGVIYRLSQSGGVWTEQVLYAGQNGQGEYPVGGVIFDKSGNLYGAFEWGSAGWGAIFELSPSGPVWTEHILFAFNTDGAPLGGLIVGALGNMYGTTSGLSDFGRGLVFELTPSDGGWQIHQLYQFSGCQQECYGPTGNLAMDAAENLYGATYNDGAYGWGTIYKLTRSNGGWTYASLHDFTGGADGGYPNGDLVIDSSGNVYGTAYCGGTDGSCPFTEGVVFEITP
ncbi:MAG TPA: choice-of-anchor tandem repeat GloVer-containing protein [Candidatus Bathyarchaeia archaeon]|nr:choice-of-anchor tandem repeat GloVer-containing protein [Candidatus Bathyarchaeia archaeon]